MSVEMYVLMNVDKTFYGALFAFYVPPKRYVLNVKLKVVVMRSSIVPSSSEGCSSDTWSPSTT